MKMIYPQRRISFLVVLAVAAVVVTEHHVAVAEATNTDSTMSIKSHIVDFDPSKAKPEGNVKGLKMISRFMVPYGPDLYPNDPNTEPQSDQDRPWKGYGFAMGATEEIAYDTKQHYLYAGSNVGYVIVFDMKDPARSILTNYGSHVTDYGKLNDIAICPEQGWLFITNGKAGTVEMFKTIQRDRKQESNELEHIQSINIGNNPSQVLSNSNCTILAVSNENENDLTHGTVTIVRDLQSDKPQITYIPMDNQDHHSLEDEIGFEGSGDARASTKAKNGWDDDYVLRKGLHMPLTKRALQYWDDLSPIAEEADFTEARNNYRSSIFVQGESLAWSGPHESELLVNLQLNNGMLRIDVARNKALALAGYGLKDHSVVPVDINSNDKTCDLKTYPYLFSMRNPDTISTLRYNGVVYLLTANEGDNKEWREFIDEIKAQALFTADGLGLPNMMAPKTFFDPLQHLGGQHTAPFHADCEGPHCVGAVKLSLGSTSIDYENDPTNPTIQRMVMFGGRGWTIYEIPQDPDALLKLVFDSGDDLERFSCLNYPWSYNSIMDDEFAPVEGANNTFWKMFKKDGDEDMMEVLIGLNDPEQDGCEDGGDGKPGACPLSKNFDSRSAKGGPQPENIVSGVACGRLVAVTTTEKESLAMLYDITDLASPDMIMMWHLNPASENKNPGVAYNDGTIGEVDPESFLFLSPDESPRGKAAIIFAGAHSGTISFWEFECEDYTETDTSYDVLTSTSSTTLSIATRQFVVSLLLATSLLSFAL